MPYVTKEDKIEISNKIKPLLKKFGLKGTLSVHNHSTLVLTIWNGPINFISNFNEVAGDRFSYNDRFEPITSGYMQINEYHYKNHFSGVALEALSEIIPEMRTKDFFDDTDIMSDYFNRSYYFSINIGTWEKPYIFNQPKEENVNMTTMYANHSTNELCDEIESLKTMVNQVGELNPKFVDINPIIANISDLASQLKEEMDTRMFA